MGAHRSRALTVQGPLRLPSGRICRRRALFQHGRTTGAVEAAACAAAGATNGNQRFASPEISCSSQPARRHRRTAAEKEGQNAPQAAAACGPCSVSVSTAADCVSRMDPAADPLDRTPADAAHSPGGHTGPIEVAPGKAGAVDRRPVWLHAAALAAARPQRKAQAAEPH